jgi:hypothetical protein
VKRKVTVPVGSVATCKTLLIWNANAQTNLRQPRAPHRRAPVPDRVSPNRAGVVSLIAELWRYAFVADRRRPARSHVPRRTARRVELALMCQHHALAFPQIVSLLAFRT